MNATNSTLIRFEDVDLAADFARREIYRFISMAMQPPRLVGLHPGRDVSRRQVVLAAIDLLRQDPSMQPDSLGPGEVSFASAPEELFRGDVANLDEEFDAIFGIGPNKDCPPYESDYCQNKDLTYRSQHMADVAGFYRGFNLDVSARAFERADHLSIEAEFMAVVISREMAAVSDNLGLERLDVCRTAQHNFFKEHIGWWMPAFGILLMRHAVSGFYSEMGLLLRAFAAAERKVLGIGPFNILPDAQVSKYDEQSCSS